MAFARKKGQIGLNIKIDGQSIAEVQDTKFLGVYIDNKLSWKKHISHLASKFFIGMGMIKKARHYLNKNGLIALYCPFVYPYFIYFNHIWGCYLTPYFVETMISISTIQGSQIITISHQWNLTWVKQASNLGAQLFGMQNSIIEYIMAYPKQYLRNN